MAITKKQANENEVEVDAPDVLELLKQALNEFLTAARSEGFEAPLDVVVRDSDGDVLREFTIERSGKIAKGKTADPTKLFLLPLTLFLTDVRGRIARLRVGATRAIESTEFLN
jgi:hypothetical protein